MSPDGGDSLSNSAEVAGSLLFWVWSEVKCSSLLAQASAVTARQGGGCWLWTLNVKMDNKAEWLQQKLRIAPGTVTLLSQACCYTYCFISP